MGVLELLANDSCGHDAEDFRTGLDLRLYGSVDSVLFVLCLVFEGHNNDLKKHYVTLDANGEE